MVADASLEATGLVQPGSLIYHAYRIRLPAGTDAAAWRDDLKSRFPDAVWRVRGLSDAGAGVRRFINRTAMFLTLVGLAALLVGDRRRFHVIHRGPERQLRIGQIVGTSADRATSATA